MNSYLLDLNVKLEVVKLFNILEFFYIRVKIYSKQKDFKVFIYSYNI